MKPEKQNIAIAIACEWTDTGITPNGITFGAHPKLGASILPAFLTDLNAMRSAEEYLPNNGEAKGLYFYWLGRLANLGGTSRECATAAQRAEAFLRTLGLWECDDIPANNALTNSHEN